MAPAAMLVDVRVLSSIRVNFENRLIQGIEWMIRNKDRYKIRIVSLSVSSAMDDTNTFDLNDDTIAEHSSKRPRKDGFRHSSAAQEQSCSEKKRLS